MLSHALVDCELGDAQCNAALGAFFGPGGAPTLSVGRHSRAPGGELAHACVPHLRLEGGRLRIGSAPCAETAAALREGVPAWGSSPSPDPDCLILVGSVEEEGEFTPPEAVFLARLALGAAMTRVGSSVLRPRKSPRSPKSSALKPRTVKLHLAGVEPGGVRPVFATLRVDVEECEKLEPGAIELGSSAFAGLSLAVDKLPEGWVAILLPSSPCPPRAPRAPRAPRRLTLSLGHGGVHVSTLSELSSMWLKDGRPPPDSAPLRGGNYYAPVPGSPLLVPTAMTHQGPNEFVLGLGGGGSPQSLGILLTHFPGSPYAYAEDAVLHLGTPPPGPRVQWSEALGRVSLTRTRAGVSTRFDCAIGPSTRLPGEDGDAYTVMGLPLAWEALPEGETATISLGALSQAVVVHFDGASGKLGCAPRRG
jgi:hypothetical protein